jgi:tetratricopeptide (TPR) repeat protein
MSARLLGDAHQFTLECKLGLSDLLVELGRNEEAQAILDQLHPFAERQLGVKMMPSILRRTAYVQMANQDFAAAERTLFDVQASVCSQLSLENPEDAASFKAFADNLRERAGKKGADDVYLESLRATQRQTSDPLEAARSLIALGQIRVRQERYANAELLLVRCLEYVSKVPSPQYSIRARAARMLATSLQFLGRPEEAESLLRETLTALQSSLGPHESYVRGVAGDLIVIYQRSGRMDEAAAIKIEAPHY